MTPRALRALVELTRAAAVLAEEVAASTNAEHADAMLTEAEAAKESGSSRYALRRARRKEELKTFGRGRGRRIRRSDLLAWLETQQAPAQGARPPAHVEERRRAGLRTKVDVLDESGVEDVERRARDMSRRRA